MNIINQILISKHLKRNVIISIITVVLLLIIIIIVSYDSQSYVQVNLSTKNGASLYELSVKNGKPQKVPLGKTAHKGRYKPGVYTFIAESGYQSTAQTINVKLKDKPEHYLDLKDIAEPVDIVSANAIDIQAKGKELRYVNASYNYLEAYSIGTPHPTNYPIEQTAEVTAAAQWVGDKKALLKLNDKSVGLLDNSVFKPFNPYPSAGVTTNDKNKYTMKQILMNSKYQIISQIGNSLFYQPSINDNAVKLVDIASGERTTMAFSNNDYYAYSATFKYPEKNSQDTGTDGDLYIKKVSDKEYSYKIPSDGSVNFAAFSPDSTKLAYSSIDGFYYVDIVGKSETRIYTQYSPKPELTTWIDSKRILYFDINGIWMMDVSTLSAYKIVSNKDAKYIKALGVSLEKNKLYYTIQLPDPKGPKSTVYSIDLTY